MDSHRSDYGLDHCKSQKHYKTPLERHQRISLAKEDYPRIDWSQTVCCEWFRHCLYEPSLEQAPLPPFTVPSGGPDVDLHIR